MHGRYDTTRHPPASMTFTLYVRGQGEHGEIRDTVSDCKWETVGPKDWILGTMDRPMWGTVEFRFRLYGKKYKGIGEFQPSRGKNVSLRVVGRIQEY